ncbi:MAG: MarR family transcriptional regulator [Archaeoglobus sp.]|nr:MarR family transcriptional regulator [Archaeoglobus sp.]
MGAEKRILDLLDEVGGDGILQSEIPKILNLSKSTVSEILSEFESKGLVIRKKISARANRVWRTENYPFPYPGVLKLGILKSSEYAYLIKAAVEEGVVVKLFNDPIDLTRSLSQGRVDMAASPLLTQLVMGVLMKNFRIIRIVAKNGSGVVFSNSKVGVFGTTEMSTMDRNLRRFLSLIGKDFKIDFKIHYFNSPESMIESLRNGEIEGLAIWEPYLTLLEEEGYKAKRFSEVIGEFVCCSLAVNEESLALNRGKIESFLGIYDGGCGKELKREDLNLIAEKLEFEVGLLERSIKSYIFCPEVKEEEIVSYLEGSGINLSRESLRTVLKLSFPSE